MKKLSVVVPCFNEEETIRETHSVLQTKIMELINDGKISNQSFIVYVDDGSNDKTYQILKELPSVKGGGVEIHILKLSRNFGHQSALLAGYTYVVDRCDCAISIDCDLQDDIQVFDQFLDKLQEGNELVYGVRKTRASDTFFKKTTAHLFYKIINFLSSEKVKMIENHADYRLLSNRALRELKNFKEKNIFLRGVIPLMGFRHSIVYYDRGERFAGETKYPLRKMFAFAWDGITGFSIQPLRLITICGIFSFICGFLLCLYALFSFFVMKTSVAGWTSTAILISLFGGIQMLSLGIVGEYVGRIYGEIKGRPNYIIEEINDEDNA